LGQVIRFLRLQVSAELNNVTDYASEVLIEDVQEVPLLGHIEEELVVLNVVSLERLVGVEVLLDLVDGFLQRRKCLVANLSQI